MTRGVPTDHAHLGDDADVDAKYAQLTDAGYHGRMTPQRTNAPYAAMVDDPDGNVILLTSDNALGIHGATRGTAHPWWNPTGPTWNATRGRVPAPAGTRTFPARRPEDGLVSHA
ncbi:VOC family protein [Leekyejoonella antrihumi]|uniref:VOC family protein n=1 Tax=Leekyejoonella antrihumi TaxID=1660198 RepID=UPI003CCC5742